MHNDIDEYREVEDLKNCIRIRVEERVTVSSEVIRGIFLVYLHFYSFVVEQLFDRILNWNIMACTAS